jgi:hypothetical protein
MNYYCDGTYRRINKTVARRLFNDGKRSVFMCPSNFRPDNMQSPTVRMYPDQGFDSQVNSFEIYNCTCRETGKTASFYILCKEDD